METIYLSLREQVAAGIFFMKSPVFQYILYIIIIVSGCFETPICLQKPGSQRRKTYSHQGRQVTQRRQANPTKRRQAHPTQGR